MSSSKTPPGEVFIEGRMEGVLSLRKSSMIQTRSNPSIRKFYIRGEGVRRSIEWLILRLIKAGARVSYNARKWHVHVSTAFPLAHHYQEVFDSG